MYQIFNQHRCVHLVTDISKSKLPLFIPSPTEELIGSCDGKDVLASTCHELYSDCSLAWKLYDVYIVSVIIELFVLTTPKEVTFVFLVDIGVGIFTKLPIGIASHHINLTTISKQY